MNQATNHSVVTWLIRNLMGIFRLLHFEIFIHVHTVLCPVSKDVVDVSTFPVDAEVGEWFSLCIHPVEGENIGIRMT